MVRTQCTCKFECGAVTLALVSMCLTVALTQHTACAVSRMHGSSKAKSMQDASTVHACCTNGHAKRTSMDGPVVESALKRVHA